MSSLSEILRRLERYILPAYSPSQLIIEGEISSGERESIEEIKKVKLSSDFSLAQQSKESLDDREVLSYIIDRFKQAKNRKILF